MTHKQISSRILARSLDQVLKKVFYHSVDYLTNQQVYDQIFDPFLDQVIDQAREQSLNS